MPAGEGCRATRTGFPIDRQYALLGHARSLLFQAQQTDAKAVKKFLGRVKPDDIVGVDNTQYKVVRVEDNHKREEEVELYLVGINIFTKQEETLSQAAISLAMGSGYCDILYRKGKPYGIKTTKEVKVKIVDHTVPDPTPTP